MTTLVRNLRLVGGPDRIRAAVEARLAQEPMTRRITAPAAMATERNRTTPTMQNAPPAAKKPLAIGRVNRPN